MSSLQTVPTAGKYGLVKKQGVLSGPALAKQQSSFGMILGGRGGASGRARGPPATGSRLGGVFRADSDDDLDQDDGCEVAHVNRDLMRAVAVTESKQGAGLSSEEISAFDYDGEYESFKKIAALDGHALSGGRNTTSTPKSRYVDSLKAVAAVREKEKDRIYERKLLRERLEEEKTLGITGTDEPKYITSAYKKKLIEEQKWDYEDKLNAEIERRNDVTTKKDGMAGFYSGLLTKNIAYGGDVSHSTSAYTAGSARQATYIGTAESESLPRPDTEPMPSVHRDTAEGGSRKRAAPDDTTEGPPTETERKLTDPALSEDDSSKTGLTRISEEEKMRVEAERKAMSVAAAKARFLERKKQKFSDESSVLPA